MSRSVLITGASRGIGRATALAFAAHGDRVAINHRDSAALATKLRSELAGDGHIVVQADVADPDAVRNMVEEVGSAFGHIDVLVNNAAVYLPHPIMDVSYDEWQACWQTTIAANLIGAANLTWCAVRHMRPGGRIVNVSSRGAYRGEPDHPAYGASKAGLNAMAQSLAAPLGTRGIAVATIAPGFVDTDMASPYLTAQAEAEIRAQSPFDRVATPEEVAEAIFWLASPAAEWASGSVLDFNGATYFR
jgi:NAD(P)-dependent dehydrogenase (short-subunit alcohol dehydrogenase family)